MPSKRKRLELKIVLDSNAIWNDGESHLLRREMSELVKAHQGDAHLVIKWILPEIVLQERLYQMRRAAASLLPSLTRLERVLGHPLNITEQTTDDSIAKNVANQVREHSLVVVQASYVEVDWSRFVSDAVNRRAPFDKKAEKGFRDAIVLETLSQVVDASPSQAQRCRIVLLTNDALLTHGAKDRIGSRGNVQVIATAEDLRGLVNTLMSTVPEEYVQRVRARAAEYFLKSPDNKSGQFYDLDTRNAVRASMKAELERVPSGADRRSSEGTWSVARPRFVKKDGQRWHWATRISIPATAYKTPEQSLTTYDLPAPNQIVSIGGDTSYLTTALSGATWGSPYDVASPKFALSGLGGVPSWPPSSAIGSIGELLKLGSAEKQVASGTTNVDAYWSASISVKGVFSKARLDSVQFIETVWKANG